MSTYELAVAHPGTEVLLVHAPYPARLRFDGLPSSLLSATWPLVEALAERGVPIGFLDPREAADGFYVELETLLRGGSVRSVCISTSTAAIEETARIVRLVREIAGNRPLVVV